MLLLPNKTKRLLVGTVLLLGSGCGANTSSNTADPAAQDFAIRSPASKDTQPQDRPQIPQTSDARPSTADDGSQPPSSSKLAVTPLLPRPIQSEQDAQECLAAAAELDRTIKEMTGQDSTSVTRRLSDCVVQYDPDNRGYTKFYPGRTRVRLYMRTSDTADLNVFIPGRKTAVIHVRIDDTTMFADCWGVAGTQEVQVGLIRSSDTEPFRRLGGWDKLADPDTLETFCMQAYNDFQQLRGN